MYISIYFFENYILATQAIEQTRHGGIKKIKVIRCKSYTLKSTKTMIFLNLNPRRQIQRPVRLPLNPWLLYQNAVNIGFPSSQFQKSYRYSNVYESIVYNNYNRYTLFKSSIISVRYERQIMRLLGLVQKGSKAMKKCTAS